MTYQETLDYLFAQLPMYQRVGHAAYKADLNGTTALMTLLGHPEKTFKSIHVAGTNGKGSTSHLIASIFQEAGYKTGLYTSPHLLDFRERIKVNGQMISEADVMNFVSANKEQVAALELSFFEWSVGLAFDHFRKEEVDIAIIEVGMGGRLDSTNVIIPELSIITNIGFDHTQFLGDTLMSISAEKAGIIKQKVPVIIGKSQRDTEGLFRKRALSLDAVITFADQEFPKDVPSCPLTGAYQKENFQTVLVAIEKLIKQGWKIESKHISSGFFKVLENTGLRGRWQIMRDSPKVICDVAHNRDGLDYVFKQLKDEANENLRLVIGFVQEKNVSELLDLLPTHKGLYLCESSVPRSMAINKLSALADEKRIDHQSFTNVKSAYLAALNDSSDKDIIFVGGSTFVVADLLTHLSPPD